MIVTPLFRPDSVMIASGNVSALAMAFTVTNCWASDCSLSFRQWLHYCPTASGNALACLSAVNVLVGNR